MGVAGVQFVFNPDAPVGSRVPPDLVMVADKYVNLEEKYRLVTTGYLNKGKDGFTMFPKCPVLVEDENCPIVSCAVQNHFEAIKTYQGKSKRQTTHRQNLVLLSRRHRLLQTEAEDQNKPEKKKSAKEQWRNLRLLRQTLSLIKINKEHVDELEKQACKVAPIVEGRIEKVSEETIKKLRTLKTMSNNAVVLEGRKIIKKLRTLKTMANNNNNNATVVEEAKEKEEEKVEYTEELPDHFFPTVSERLSKLETLIENGTDTPKIVC